LKRLETEENKSVWLLSKTGGDAKRVARKQADISALSGRSMEEIAEKRNAVWQSNRGRAANNQQPRRMKSSRSLARGVGAR
jgi:hypothetical protein